MRILNLVMLMSFVTLVSCITRETMLTADTLIINNSGHEVLYKAYGVHASQVHDDDNIVEIQLKNGEQATERRMEEGTVVHFPIGADSVHIFFDNEKVLKYQGNSESLRNPYHEDSYVTDFTTKYHYKYTYTITEEDYNKALPIGEVEY